MNIKPVVWVMALLSLNCASAMSSKEFEVQGKLLNSYADQLAKAVDKLNSSQSSTSCLKSFGKIKKPANLNLSVCGILTEGKTNYISLEVGNLGTSSLTTLSIINDPNSALVGKKRYSAGINLAIKMLNMRRTLKQPLPEKCDSVGIVTEGMVSCSFKVTPKSFLLTYVNKDGTRLYYDGSKIKDLTPPPLPDLSK